MIREGFVLKILINIITLKVGLFVNFSQINCRTNLDKIFHDNFMFDLDGNRLDLLQKTYKKIRKHTGQCENQKKITRKLITVEVIKLGPLPIK